MEIKELEAICNEIDPALMHQGVRFGLRIMGAPEMVGIMSGKPITLKALMETPTLMVQTIDFWITAYPDEFSDKGSMHVQKLLIELLSRDDVSLCPKCNSPRHVIEFAQSKSYAKVMCSNPDCHRDIDIDWIPWNWEQRCANRNE